MGENSHLPWRFHRNEKKSRKGVADQESRTRRQAINPAQHGTFFQEPSFVARLGGNELDSFQRLEALVDSAGGDGIEEANALLRRFTGRSEKVATAIDEFMLDFMTLVFVVETGEEGFEKPIRKLARARLSKIKLLVGVPA